MKETVIFDLDGTLSDNSHRQYLAQEKRWDEYTQACISDSPKSNIIRLCNLYYDAGYSIYILTGRDDSVFEMTGNWLTENRVKYTNIVTRKSGNYQKDTELKKKWLTNFGFTPENVECVFEDRDSCVKMYRELGYTCLQVADGGF